MKSTNVAIYATNDKPTNRCAWCLKPAWASADACRECRGIEPNLRHPVTDAHALTGGRWVTRGGIKVWTGPRPADDEQVARRPIAECGTESGYSRHNRRGEKACDACKRAKSDATQRRYRRKDVA